MKKKTNQANNNSKLAALEKELKAKNRELKIEAALERVRVVAMRMNEPGDMIKICRVISKQLQTLKVENIRNVQTAIINDEKGTYLNYEYFTQYNTTSILEIETKLHPKVEEFANEIKKSTDAFFKTNFKGKELKDWREYRRKTNQNPDPILDKANSLHYYFYSIGPGALGVSTYSPLNEEDIAVFKRFRNVFELAYRRFIDIEQAIAQAKEAQIEAALERVRSRSLAMQKSDELQAVAHTVFEKLKELNVDFYTSIIILFEEGSKDVVWWLESNVYQNYQKILVPYAEISYLQDVHKSRESGVDFFSKTYSFKEKNKLFRHLFSRTDLKIVPKPQQEFLLGTDFATMAVSLSKNTGIHITRYSQKSFSEQENEIFKKFAKVFDQAYTRFLDLQKSEAQTREAKIEAALERVRAKAMAMHTSNDLSETMGVVFTELPKLGISSLRCGVILLSKSSTRGEFYAAATTQESDSFTMVGAGDMKKHPVFMKQYESWLEDENYFITLSGKELESYYREIFARLSKAYNPREHKIQTEHGYYFPFSEGMFYAWSEEPYSKESINILDRFKAIIDLTFRRYLDLQKAEAQTREAQIEASLERVRASSMAMHKSEELKGVIRVVYEQFVHLKINVDHAGFVVDYTPKGDWHFWIADERDIPSKINHPYFESVWANQFNEAKEKGADFFVTNLNFEEKNKFYNELLSYVPGLPKASKDFYLSCPGLAASTVLLENVALYIENFSGIPYSDEENKILIRFGKVFQQTYTRFLDLQKAEVQAMEVKIEMCLERVRARTMAMHKSDELSETSFVLFKQLEELGEVAEQISIGIFNEQEGVFELYATIYGSQWKETGRFPLTKHPVHRKTYTAWKEQKKSLIIDLSGKELEDFNRFKMENSTQYKSAEELPKNRWVIHSAFFSKGVLIFSTHEPRTSETLQLLERFAGVFDLTYTRFLDLKNAEAQAREAKIESALERVRSKTMAMQQSSDLHEVIKVVTDQLLELGIKFNVANFAKVHSEGSWDMWISTPEQSYPALIYVPYFDHRLFNDLNKIISKGDDFLADVYDYEEKNIFFKHFFENTLGKNTPEERKRYVMSCKGLARSLFLTKNIWLSVSNYDGVPFSDEENAIFKRFAKVFEQTYTRFLDLQKAEAQAKEAKIEASLEKVRAKAMSMHTPGDLSETVSLFFNELKSLNVLPWRCGVGRIDEETRTTYLTTTSITKDGTITKVTGKLKQTGHPVLDGIFDHWKLQKEYFPILRGDEINKYYSIIKPQIAYPDYPFDAVQYGHNIPFKEGFIFAWTENRLTEEELQIFRRFSSVLSLTYRRYMDLKEAEARAIESVRQASLDRIRAEIASMRTSEDLNRITPVIWRELKTLGVPFFRCGVYIVNEKTETVQVYLTTPDGKSLGVLHLSFNSNEITSNTVNHWRKKQVYKEHWNKQEFINWTKYLVEQNQIPTAESYQGSVAPPESLDLNFVPFTQGMLYVGDVNPLTDEKLELVKTLAEAFSIAYARYEDFKNLEDAKNKIEITLNELKSAQAQLIHSEKMASLGELTAGIAHEIKNPLNFVNNFSEVSRELLDEMKIELQENKIKDVIGLVENLKQNLDKINHHGKRADSIVKGMLLHSRGTSGEKVLTNINDLLDQYVMLAYHGLRAQNKDFNITIEKDYDKTLEKINVVPQDISRVFLNLVNNACYAAFEKKKMNGKNFSPTLTVSTKNLHNKVEIRVRDNGNGIPESIKEQIFNPFFTTKPTGEGTGLGLSLSYDIVIKQHSGEINFESEEGKYTEFVVSLPAS